MAKGKTYGRFSGRGTSPYDVMTMAKTVGAKKRTEEAEEEWMKEFNKWQGKMTFAKTFGSIVDIASMFLLPDFTTGSGASTAGKPMPPTGIPSDPSKFDKGVGAVKKAGLGWTIGSLAQKLMEQWQMGGGILAERKPPEFKPDFEVFGTQFADPISRRISGERDNIMDAIKKMYTDRAQLHALKAFDDKFSIADLLGKQ